MLNETWQEFGVAAFLGHGKLYVWIVIMRYKLSTEIPVLLILTTCVCLSVFYTIPRPFEISI
jgi:hypothetical protein